MPMTAWYILAGLCAVVAAVSLAVMIHRVATDRTNAEDRLTVAESDATVTGYHLAARRREVRQTLDYIADTDPDTHRSTFDRLVADVTASDYGDQDTWSDYGGAPIFDRLCADVAQREAATLDAEREAGA